MLFPMMNSKALTSQKPFLNETVHQEKNNQEGPRILVSLCKYDVLLVPARTLFREER